MSISKHVFGDLWYFRSLSPPFCAFRTRPRLVVLVFAAVVLFQSETQTDSPVPSAMLLSRARRVFNANPEINRVQASGPPQEEAIDC